MSCNYSTSKIRHCAIYFPDTESASSLGGKPFGEVLLRSWGEIDNERRWGAIRLCESMKMMVETANASLCSEVYWTVVLRGGR